MLKLKPGTAAYVADPALHIKFSQRRKERKVLTVFYNMKSDYFIGFSLRSWRLCESNYLLYVSTHCRARFPAYDHQINAV